MGPDRNINHLYPKFREIVEKIIHDMNAYALKYMVGYEWGINEGVRSAEYQNHLYQQGRTRPGRIITSLDGYKKLSGHQSGLAVDLVPKNSKGWTWEIDNKHWDYLGHLARKYGMNWLGNTTLRDRPHIEWPRSDKQTYEKAREWLKTLKR